MAFPSSLPPSLADHKDLLLQPFPLCILLFQLPTPARIRWEPTSQALQRSKRSVKQVGELQVFAFPPVLQLQSPNLIPSSVSDHLRWSLLTTASSQVTKQILAENPVFLPAVNTLSSPTSKPIYITKCLLLKPRNTLL